MIGRGAMADVFASTDTDRDERVAVKILRASVASDETARKRFFHEADVQKRIDHRNVARMFEVGVGSSGAPFIVMELLRGRSLFTLLRKSGPVAPVHAASYGYQALQGLAATHEVGVLHRDLKPANLMLEPGPGPVDRVVLIDFGFAALGPTTGLTMQGTVVGSLSYIAPERLRGRAADERADLYGIGCILYELLCGRPPIQRPSDYEIIEAAIRERPVPPSKLAPHAGISPALDEVIMRALAKRPDEREPTARAMADALEVAINT